MTSATTAADAAEGTGRRDQRTRGRKRDADRTDAIIEAARELLFEVGVDQFRVQDVAARAESGTGAIYRRWATKEALIADAIRSFPKVEAPITDDPVADLRAYVDLKFGAVSAQPEVLSSIVSAIRADEGIAEAVDEVYTMEPFRDAVARVIGADHPHLELLTDLAPALALYRATFGRHTQHSTSLTDDVLAVVELARASRQG